ncbi:hypothetical protein [Idiomarina abyssalis]|uniref:hypothetical protein n=1 Tax=Idiomarina abyssalis TaxID=86102 RepID=UPI003A9500C2
MIKILVIEDNPEKREHIFSVTLKSGVHSENIDMASNARDALNSLKGSTYDIVVLDLKLPLRSSSTLPNDGAGKKILQSIIEHDVQVPNSVICLTSFPELQESFSQDFTSFDINIYDTTTSDNWISALEGKINWHSGRNKKIKSKKKGKVIVTIHGVNTAGAWQDTLENELSEFDGIICKHYKYIHKAPFKILIPIWRKKVVKAFYNDLRSLIKSYPNHDYYFFSHSFGTFVLVEALGKMSSLNAPEIKVITLAGSVLKRSFGWEDICSELSVDKVINDCGVNDLALPFSYCFAPGLGMAGRTGFYGFDGELVKNRYFEGGHSFFEESSEFYKKYWIPLIFNHVIESEGHPNAAPNEAHEKVIELLAVAIYIAVIIVVAFLFI